MSLHCLKKERKNSKPGKGKLPNEIITRIRAVSQLEKCQFLIIAFTTAGGICHF